MNATEENNEAADWSSSQDKPRSEPTEARAPEAKRKATNPQAGKHQPPTPPQVPQNRSKTRILPERQQAESFATPAAPPAHTPGTTPPPDPAEALANLGWMPSPEDQVARFLNDVADIAPPPVREREGTAPHFVPPPAISPEEAQRKKAKADPFWSQVVATPMEQPPPVAPARPRRASRRRSRRGRRTRWFLVAGGILLLVVVGLGVVVYLHPALLPFK